MRQNKNEETRVDEQRAHVKTQMENLEHVECLQSLDHVLTARNLHLFGFTSQSMTSMILFLHRSFLIRTTVSYA